MHDADRKIGKIFKAYLEDCLREDLPRQIRYKTLKRTSKVVKRTSAGLRMDKAWDTRHGYPQAV